MGDHDSGLDSSCERLPLTCPTLLWARPSVLAKRIAHARPAGLMLEGPNCHRMTSLCVTRRLYSALCQSTVNPSTVRA